VAVAVFEANISALPPSFIESSFTTKREYEAHLAATKATARSRFAPFDAARDALIRELCDTILPLISSSIPYAIYGFSNGALFAFLMAVELERRGAALPCRILCAGRGAPHGHKRANGELSGADALTSAAMSGATALYNFYRGSDEQTIAQAEAAGVLAPEAERRGIKINPRFGPVSRAGVIGMFGVGSQIEETASGGAASKCAYASDPPRLERTPITALLGSEDEMWPSDVFLQRWADLTVAGLFRAVTVRGVPHHHLQSHPEVMKEVFAELAVLIASQVTGN